jgi:hypothetical protein
MTCLDPFKVYFYFAIFENINHFNSDIYYHDSEKLPSSMKVRMVISKVPTL